MKHSALKKFAAAAVLAVSFTGLSMVSASTTEPAPAPAVKVTAGHDQLGSFAPEFAHLNDDVLFGEVWSRTDKLPAKIRSIVTVTSLVSSGVLDSSLKFHIMKAKENGVNLVLAVDTKVGDAFSNDANTKIVPSKEIPDGWEGMDIGPKSEELFANVIKGSKTILWNGPTGVFEFDNFSHGSRAVGEAIVEATKNGAFSLVGGGDSVACVNKFGLASGVSYVSTGGGALLEAIEGKVLPGIAAIKG